MEGWIKMYRKLLDNPIASDLELMGFLTWSLLKANHKPNSIYINKQKVEIQRGQFVTSTEGISKKFNVSRSKAYRMISVMESEHILKHESTTKYTVITINNYDEYQELETQKDIRKTSKRQQKDTNKNDKNEKNKYIESFISYFNEKSGKNYQVTDDRSDALDRRLKKYSMEQVKLAIDALLKSPHHIGKNNTGTWYATPDFLLRSDEMIDRWLNASTPAKLPVVRNTPLADMIQ